MVAITEMIGIDDYGSGGEAGPLEIFTIADAKTIVDGAGKHDIAELSLRWPGPLPAPPSFADSPIWSVS